MALSVLLGRELPLLTAFLAAFLTISEHTEATLKRFWKFNDQIIPFLSNYSRKHHLLYYLFEIFLNPLLWGVNRLLRCLM